MKSTDHFKQTIQTYLEQRVQSDALFAPVYANPNKNIDDCITCIFNTVKASGCNGFTDDEIYSMALHYYDEENIDIGKPMDCQVVINHTVVLTGEEQQQARQQAMQKAQDEAYAKMKQPARKFAAKPTATDNQQNLFDL